MLVCISIKERIRYEKKEKDVVIGITEEKDEMDQHEKYVH